jgi:hypothetical protein
MIDLTDARSRALLGASLLAISLALAPTAASAHRPLPGQAGRYGPVLAPYRQAPPTTSGTWARLTGDSQFPGHSPDTALLMTDGSVMMHDACTPNWYRLTPDVTDSYLHGSWHSVGSMNIAYGPVYFASAVLPDGRLIVEGGEYNFNGTKCASAETYYGAIYDPVANSWGDVSPPSGWTRIGDASSAVLQNGNYIIAGPKETVGVLELPSLTWTITGGGKADSNGEEGWTLLPDGDVLTVDIQGDDDSPSPAEIYSSTTGTWSATGTALNILVDPVAHEIGPAVLLPTGNVFQVGANSCGAAGCAGHTGIYSPSTSTWSAGPDLPQISGSYYDTSDGPAAILPDGNVLVQASPSYSCVDKNGKALSSCKPSHFFEYDGSTFTRVNEPADAPNIPAYEGRMLVLPSGNILWSSQRASGMDVEIYSPKGSPDASWRPTITGLSTLTLTRGTTNYSATGTQFQGVSNGAAYGDDAQMATNFPLVRITNKATGHICFARTHDFNATHTSFDMPAASPPPWQQPCETGASKLRIVANGLQTLRYVNVTVN